VVVQVDGEVDQSRVPLLDGVEEGLPSGRHVGDQQPAVGGAVRTGRSTPDETSPTSNGSTLLIGAAPRRSAGLPSTLVMSELNVVDQQKNGDDQRQVRDPHRHSAATGRTLSRDFYRRRHLKDRK